MTVGVETLVLACVESVSGSQGKCPSGYVESLQPAFLLDPSVGPSIAFSFAPFDPLLGAEYFAFSFGTVIGVYLLSLSIGAVIQVLKRS